MYKGECIIIPLSNLENSNFSKNLFRVRSDCCHVDDKLAQLKVVSVLDRVIVLKRGAAGRALEPLFVAFTYDLRVG